MSSTNHQLTLNSIIDPSWCKHTLYPAPIQCENYSIGHKCETGQQKEKKGASNSIYLYTFLQILGSKFKIPNVTEAVSTFRHLENRHLMAQQTAQR